MADLHNLLDEINNDDEFDLQDNEDSPLESSDQRPVIPPALAEAASDRRRNRDERNDSPSVYEGDGRIPDPEYEHLKSLWLQELACPELLPADVDTVSLHVDMLGGQEETIEDLWQRSRQSQRDDGASGEVASLMAQIIKMDLDRTRFLLVDLARTRMAKIENHALYYKSMTERMTEEETSYLRQYGELVGRHYGRSVLDHLPKDAWKKLDEPEMIDTPNLEDFVFCRVLETVQIDISSDTSIPDESTQEEEEFMDTVQEHSAGACLIVMYKSIRDMILEGKVELLM